MTIRVVVADDQGMVRSGFSILLNAQPDIEVVGEAVNGQEAQRRDRIARRSLGQGHHHRRCARA